MPKTVVMAAVTAHRELIDQVWELVFSAPAIAGQAVAGQFVHLRVTDGYQPLLRRPFSICDVDPAAGTVKIIYRIVGPGTARLAKVKNDDIVDVMGPLGNGFSLDCRRPLLVGGGMGIAPLVFLARQLGSRPLDVVLGGRTRDELFWRESLPKTARNIYLTTDDGSLGLRGLAPAVIPDLLAGGDYDIVYTCGPQALMREVAAQAAAKSVDCQVSLEEHMACGVGACLSCTCAAGGGGRRKVCTDGPVFWAREVAL